MKVVALVSGGKDSCFAMMKSIQYGHEIVALANLMPADDSVDELDSYMYQTVGHQIIVSYAECMGIPLFRRRIQGSTRHQKLNYRITPGDEVEDMYILLNEVKRQLPSVTAVCSGAIASDYQRLRVESVCSRLGLVSLAYLWKQDQSLLLHEMINNGILAITVKVAAMGLDPVKHLGKELSSLDSDLHKLKRLYGINVCGEGGEYETLTLDCPLFKMARIVLDEFKVVMHSSDSIAPVGILHPVSFHLKYKEKTSSLGICDNTNLVDHEKVGLLFEIQGDCFQNCDALQSVADASSDNHILNDVPDNRLQISCSRMENTFSMCCWLQDSCDTSPGLQDDLKTVLREVESELLARGCGWKNVLYIHLYLANMTEFALANETYVSFITQESTTHAHTVEMGRQSVIALVLICAVVAGVGGQSPAAAPTTTPGATPPAAAKYLTPAASPVSPPTNSSPAAAPQKPATPAPVSTPPASAPPAVAPVASPPASTPPTASVPTSSPPAASVPPTSPPAATVPASSPPVPVPVSSPPVPVPVSSPPVPTPTESPPAPESSPPAPVASPPVEVPAPAPSKKKSKKHKAPAPSPALLGPPAPPSEAPGASEEGPSPSPSLEDKSGAETLWNLQKVAGSLAFGWAAVAVSFIF